MGGVKVVGLLFLDIGSVLDVRKWHLDGDGDIFDAGDIKVSSFEECLSDKFWHLSLSEYGEDLFGVVFLLLALLSERDGVLVYFLSKFSH